MKLVTVLLCTFVVGALGTFAPTFNKQGVAGKAAIGLGKAGAEKLKASDLVRGTNRKANAAEQWESHDVKKSALDQDFEKQGEQASHDATSQRQAHGQHAAGFQQAKDAANKAGSKASAASAAKAAKDKWASNMNFEKQQAWAGNDGYKKNNKKHEGISYSYDKKFHHNDNENGGFNTGHSLSDQAIDDQGLSRSSYDRVGGSHGARNGHANWQSADRSSGFGDGAWKNANSADRHGRDMNSAAAGLAKDREWAEKRDDAKNLDQYNRYEKARAGDALNSMYALDRNANRDTVGFGATSKGLYGKGVGVVAPAGYGYGYGHPGKKTYGGDLGLKGLNRAKGVADNSNLWDKANTNKNQHWANLGAEDSQKNGNVANQQLDDMLKGFNRQKTGWYYDKGFAQDAAAKDQGAKAANNQWAKAGSSKAAQQGRYDNDEVARLKSNKQWNVSDRDKKVKEFKKYFSNDKTGGQNFERLKFDKAQTEDAAAADYANKQDNANRWQSSHKFDEKNQAAHSTDAARARDASDSHWSQDAAKNANGAQKKAGAAQDGSSRRVWAASNNKHKYGVDQARDGIKTGASAAQENAGQRAGYDAKVLKGAKSAIGSQAAKQGGFNNYNYPSAGYYGNYPSAGYYGNYPSAGYNGNYRSNGYYGKYPSNGYYGNYPANGYYGNYPSRNVYGGFGKGFGGYPGYY